MIELYQFELSQYSEKVRFILDYKGLEYKKIEVTPGVGQFELFRLSGQKQVPIIKDGNTIISDSTAIAMYLDRQYPEKPIVPTNPKDRGQCLLMEEWADESIGPKSRKVLFGALTQNPSFRTLILPNETPDFLKNIVSGIPSELLEFMGFGVGCTPDLVKEARDSLKQDLEALCLILADRPYLVTDTPCLADFTVAGLSLLLKIPEGSYLDIPEQIKGKGIPGLADNSDYEPFFTWRDRIYADYRQKLTSTGTSASGPQSIQID
ncbi:glutathione S-transferase [Limnofasciculus baicalensis]|uniref:Glutathione S-transferase family protein n=1 Tax=Limnofasciculus baicalensis BBK-W-15 TaxID=2699891 RepID=A0AAE3GUX5_9CYAN|nr:glutathione S-transferase family protein [Limnofasciculus baicalensis]MCP2730924.1 glutathione S-transferase family protein [Limnofasciculus baicalensis BBK-W-15]